LCERLQADVEKVTRAMGLDPRIGPQFLRAGLGFGGFCLPKDIQAFIRLAERSGMDFALLREAERINNQRITHYLEKARQALWVLKEKQIGILGLAFKANTDDIRFAPSVELIRQLVAEGAHVRVYDPAAMEKTRAVFAAILCGKDAYEVARDADALMIVTDWEEFRTLDWPRIRNESQPSRAWAAWARGIVRFRWPVAVTTLGLLIALLLPIFGIKIGETSTDALAHSGPAYNQFQTLRAGGVPSGIVSPM
jgi:nucleotide sugar dehydrogenase